MMTFEDLEVGEMFTFSGKETVWRKLSNQRYTIAEGGTSRPYISKNQCVVRIGSHNGPIKDYQTIMKVKSIIHQYLDGNISETNALMDIEELVK